ncbi:MAG: phage holin family protein [Simkaniaceae bacterium]|nr:phage holin family protein [Simkaniaceae bacterium]
MIRLFVTATVVVLIAHLDLPGIEVKNTWDTICFGLILGVLNAVVRPILIFLVLPITILTMGLFLLVINAFLFWLASEITYGVHIYSFWGAFIGGCIVWITGIVTNRLIWNKTVY